ncbi:hypothetical protein M3Y99_00107600 [Aphelenchoides fujianensis]|nr:hypothetical protein M3Y99_00107600 [Aphelenchoides fujianensis]
MDTASFGSFDDEMEVEIEWNDVADKNSTNAHDSSTSAGRKTVPCGECGTAQLAEMINVGFKLADVQRDALPSLRADGHAEATAAELRAHTPAKTPLRVCKFECPQCAVACRVAASLQPRADGTAAANDAWHSSPARPSESPTPRRRKARAEALAIPKALLAEVFAGAPLADRTPARRVRDEAARFDEELRSVEFRTDEARAHAHVSQSSKRLLRNSCPDCGLMINSMLFPAHLQAHALKKGWQCSLCGIRLPSQRQRREHEAQVHHFRRCKFDQSRKEAIRIDDEQLRCFRSPGSNFRAVQRGAVKSIAEFVRLPALLGRSPPVAAASKSQTPLGRRKRQKSPEVIVLDD